MGWGAPNPPDLLTYLSPEDYSTFSQANSIQNLSKSTKLCVNFQNLFDRRGSLVLPSWVQVPLKTTFIHTDIHDVGNTVCPRRVRGFCATSKCKPSPKTQCRCSKFSSTGPTTCHASACRHPKLWCSGRCVGLQVSVSDVIPWHSLRCTTHGASPLETSTERNVLGSQYHVPSDTAAAAVPPIPAVGRGV